MTGTVGVSVVEAGKRWVMAVMTRPTRILKNMSVLFLNQGYTFKFGLESNMLYSNCFTLFQFDSFDESTLWIPSRNAQWRDHVYGPSYSKFRHSGSIGQHLLLLKIINIILLHWPMFLLSILWLLMPYFNTLIQHWESPKVSMTLLCTDPCNRTQLYIKFQEVELPMFWRLTISPTP